MEPVSKGRKQIKHDGYTPENPPAQYYIESVLKKLKVEPAEANKSQVVRDIAKEFGVIENLKTYSEAEAIEYIEEKFGHTIIKKVRVKILLTRIISQNMTKRYGMTIWCGFIIFVNK